MRFKVILIVSCLVLQNSDSFQCTNTPTDQQAIETLFSLAEKYARASKETGQQAAGAAKDVKSTDNAGSMEHNLRLLIERFANSTSLDDVFGSLEKIYHDADEDPELRSWFREMNTFIRYFRRPVVRGRC